MYQNLIVHRYVTLTPTVFIIIIQYSYLKLNFYTMGTNNNTTSFFVIKFIFDFSKSKSIHISI